MTTTTNPGSLYDCAKVILGIADTVIITREVCMIYPVIKEGVPFYVAVVIHDYERMVHTSMDANYLRKIVYDRYGQLLEIVDMPAYRVNKPIGTR